MLIGFQSGGVTPAEGELNCININTGIIKAAKDKFSILGSLIVSDAM